MEDKQFAKEPLLYIHQPVIKKPTALMQHHYYGSKHVTEDNEHIQVQQRGRGNNSNEKFSNMTLKQKIIYFIEKPEHVPEIQCLLRTNERTLQGIIKEFKNNEVYINLGRGSSIVKIPFEQIVSIQMVGF